jgi:membrane-anchored protein YejM (alkaline phosphatase superfamily)
MGSSSLLRGIVYAIAVWLALFSLAAFVLGIEAVGGLPTVLLLVVASIVGTGIGTLISRLLMVDRTDLLLTYSIVGAVLRLCCDRGWRYRLFYSMGASKSPRRR